MNIIKLINLEKDSPEEIAKETVDNVMKCMDNNAEQTTVIKSPGIQIRIRVETSEAYISRTKKFLGKE